MINECDGTEFFDAESGNYIFPFEWLDKTPGGSNLGRFEWQIELLVAPETNKNGEQELTAILLCASQTRDPRYAYKIFRLAVRGPSLMTSCVSDMPFFKGCWMVGYCPEHQTTFMRVYAPDGARRLVIQKSSSVALRIEFEGD